MKLGHFIIFGLIAMILAFCISALQIEIRELKADVRALEPVHETPEDRCFHTCIDFAYNEHEEEVFDPCVCYKSCDPENIMPNECLFFVPSKK